MKRLDFYFNKKSQESVSSNEDGSSNVDGSSNEGGPSNMEAGFRDNDSRESPPTKIQRVHEGENNSGVELDPGVRKMMWDYPVDKRDEKANNRLLLQVSIDTAKFLSFQTLSFRGHDNGPESRNRGNFLELIEFIASYNTDVASVVLQNAPANATYTSPQVQKEILMLYARNIKRFIIEEINGEKFCIIVDESRDEFKREQMAIVLRFVDRVGIIRERLFDIVHVEDTRAVTLKKAISDVLSYHNLDIKNIRGQGYDGASNMRGEWNGLQALFIKECPYAYYVHCFAHRLQLILVATAKSVIPIENFFSILNLITNVVDSSSKRHDQLHIARAIQIQEEIMMNDLETGREKNQVRSIQHAGDTRWGSHFRSLYNLLDMYEVVLSVLDEVINDHGSISSRAAADGAYEKMLSFEFVFILHFLKELLGMIDNLCELLQRREQHILNVIDAVENTKEIIQTFRENGWNVILQKVKSFCEKHEIDVPNMNGIRESKRRQKIKQNLITYDHFFRIDIFFGTIDCILHEMNLRFNENSMELLKLSSALDPRGGYKSFNIPDLMKLVEKFYPSDFTSEEKGIFPYQLQIFEADIRKNPRLKEVSTLPELCQVLFETEKSIQYYLIDRLIRLILTLPVSIATAERAFSSMKLVKTRLQNKMENDFLRGSLLMHVEKEVAESFDIDSIIEDFDSMEKRRSQF